MLHTIKSENLRGLRKVLDYLYDGEQEAFNIMFFIKSNYKEWAKMIIWLKRNNIKGKKMIELFQNESKDGGGYHMGATYILSRIKGHRHEVVPIKVNELR